MHAQVKCRSADSDVGNDEYWVDSDFDVGDDTMWISDEDDVGNGVAAIGFAMIAEM